jgi:hypothetical protein
MSHRPRGYFIGDMIEIEASFKNRDEVLTDPDTVKVRVRKPDGSFETLDSAKVSTGLYRATVVADMSGIWQRRVESTGGVTAADESEFFVRRSTFP